MGDVDRDEYDNLLGHRDRLWRERDEARAEAKRLRDRFRGGPAWGGERKSIHSLHVYMQGDGRHSVGWYQQVWDSGKPLGVFEWHPEEAGDAR